MRKNWSNTDSNGEEKKQKEYIIFEPEYIDADGIARVVEIATTSKDIAIERANKGRKLINIIDNLRGK
jgi:hypothetical protein